MFLSKIPFNIPNLSALLINHLPKVLLAPNSAVNAALSSRCSWATAKAACASVDAATGSLASLKTTASSA